MRLRGDGAALARCQPQQTFNPTADQLVGVEAVTAIGIEADTSLRGADRHFIAQGRDELLARFETSALFRG